MDQATDKDIPTHAESEHAPSIALNMEADLTAAKSYASALLMIGEGLEDHIAMPVCQLARDLSWSIDEAEDKRARIAEMNTPLQRTRASDWPELMTPVGMLPVAETRILAENDSSVVIAVRVEKTTIYQHLPFLTALTKTAPSCATTIKARKSDSEDPLAPTMSEG